MLNTTNVSRELHLYEFSGINIGERVVRDFHANLTRKSAMQCDRKVLGRNYSKFVCCSVSYTLVRRHFHSNSSCLEGQCMCGKYTAR